MKTNKNSRLKAIEKLLIPRLKLIGFIMMSFGLLMFVYASFSKPYITPQDNIETPEEMEQISGVRATDTPFLFLTEKEKSRSYAVVVVFALMGLGLIILARKKYKEIE